MQRANDAGLQVGAALVRVHQVGIIAGEGNRHGIDGEIPPAQIVRDGSRLNVRQGAGPGVGLAAGRYQVNGDIAGQPHRSRAESRMYGQPAIQRVGKFPGQGWGAAHHGDVQVFDWDAQQVVAHRPADQIGGHAGVNGQAANCIAHRLPARVGVQKNTDGRGVGGCQHRISQVVVGGPKSVASASRRDKPGCMFGKLIYDTSAGG